MTTRSPSLKKFPFGLETRDHGGLCVHENQMYTAAYGGGIYRVNADGSETLVVNQNRNWYGFISAFGKLLAITNATSSSGLYEIDPYAGTAVLRFTLNRVYCLTQMRNFLYLCGADSQRITEVTPGAWTSVARGSNEIYRAITPSPDGKSLLAAAARMVPNYGGVLKTYNTTDWSSVASGQDEARNGFILEEDSVLTTFGSGVAPWLVAFGNVFGNTERSLCSSSEATTGAYAIVRYNSGYYLSGWPEKIYRFPAYNRRPLGSKLIATVGAPQRNFNYGLCATPDGILVAGSFEYTTNGIYTSLDAGETWTARTTPNTIAPTQIIAAPISGAVGYRLVCVGEGGIMTSDDRGDTWTVRSSGNNFNCICRDAHDGALYAGGYSGTWGYGASSLVYKSVDGGITWTSNFSSVSGGMIQGLAYNSELQKLVAVTFYGANRVYVSSNHGTSWVSNATIQKQYWRGVLYDNHRGCMLAWTAGLGDGSAYVMRSYDGGSTWTYDSTSMGFNDVILEPGGRILGCRNNDIYAADNGLDFIQLPGAAAGAWAKLVYSPYHDIIAVCAVNGSARFMTSLAGRKTPRRIWWSYASAPARSFNQGLIGTHSGRIIATITEYSTTSVAYSDDVGLTWNMATTSNAVAPMSVISVPRQSSLGYRLVATCETAAGLNPAMHSDDNGITWTLSSLAGIRGVIHLCRDHSTGYLFATGYAGGDTSDTATTEILRSTDDGATWTSIYTNVGGGLGVRIAYDPIRNRLCAITRNGANHSYVSSDSGVTWTPYSGSATRPWRDMIWDAARGCLVKVCHESTRTASILGNTYNTVIMPDGKEWTAANLKWTGAGQWWNNAGSDDGDGRYYTANEAWTTLATALVGSGWRAPTLTEFTAMMNAAGGAGLAGGRLKSTGTTLWNAPNTGSSNIYGFSMIGSGRYWGAWDYKRNIAKFWLSANFSGTAYYGSDVNAQTLWTGSDPAYTSGRLPIRLIRDYTPTSEHMYRSFDGGITWSPVPGVLPAQCVVADRAGRLFTAGIGTGMRSDNGTDWSPISVDGSSWRKLALLEKYDKVVGMANLGLNRFMLTGNT